MNKHDTHAYLPTYTTDTVYKLHHYTNNKDNAYFCAAVYKEYNNKCRTAVYIDIEHYKSVHSHKAS